ncbi:hypothetical protein CMI47_06655 [Candidatus Pacearchaeota archaeon]|jgi:hypothetical protein|nr:hypothetical protein [Candidatus Pacearchaeota archaeon]|tara:strand:- start:2973 stop:3404 length:432 start_codon:yes stop_codon:yes gene_type:complete
MNLEDLKEEAKKDLPILNHEHMEQESFKNQIIKPKWLEYKTNFEQLLIMRRSEHQKLYREKWEYYGGKSDAKVYAARPFDIKVLKNDLQMYIQSDDEILELQNKIAYYELIIKYIEGVVKSIDNRGWDIRHAQDWKKFEAGMI